MTFIIQAITGQRSIILLLPKDMTADLPIEKGEYLQCSIDGNKLIVERVGQ